MCYTCIIAVWLDPVIQSSNPVHRSSPQSSPVIRDGPTSGDPSVALQPYVGHQVHHMGYIGKLLCQLVIQIHNLLKKRHVKFVE